MSLMLLRCYRECSSTACLVATECSLSELLMRMRATYRTGRMPRRLPTRRGLFLQVQTPFGWRISTPPGTNPRTVRNFPIQSGGAEILRAACIIGERRGIGPVAPVHDALMCEGPADCAENTRCNRVWPGEAPHCGAPRHFWGEQAGRLKICMHRLAI
jgi:hypothetical protein